MYFWKIKQLKQHLIEHGLTETQLFYYILIYVALSVIGMEVVGYFPHTEPDSWAYFDSVLNILIPVIGTIAAFYANGGSAGSKFAERYFAIGFVITMRFTALLIPLVVLLAIYLGFTSEVENEAFIASPHIEFQIFLIWYAAMYVFIVKHISNVANA